MNKKPTYSEQWQKVTEAYVNDKLNPYNKCACFIGNLLNGESCWSGSHVPYRQNEVLNLEVNFLSIIRTRTIGGDNADIYVRAKSMNAGETGKKRDSVFRHPNYENALFEAMVSTLELLREIHISNGEKVDKIELKKRELQPS